MTAWIVWTGGSCPVAPDAVVTVRRRYAPAITVVAGQVRWSHDQYREYGAEDIIAYRREMLPPD